MNINARIASIVVVTGAMIAGVFTLAASSSGSPTNLVPAEVALFSDSAQPAHPNNADASSVEIGVRFTVDTPGLITGAEFYKGKDDHFAAHTGKLWDANGNKLISSTVADETSQGLQKVYFRERIAAKVGTTYVVSFDDPQGHYAADQGGFSKALDNSPLHAPVNAGVYSNTVNTAPTQTYNSSNYWVSPIFAPSPSTTTTTTTSSPTTSTSVIPTTTSTTPVTSPSTTTSTTSKPDPTGFVVHSTADTGPKGTLNNCPDPGNITTAGTVVQNCIIHGNIGILADNVTIKNTQIFGQVYVGRLSNGSAAQDTIANNPVIQDTEFAGDNGGGSGLLGVRDVGGIYQRNYMHNWENCATMWTSTNAQMLDNFCTDSQGPSGAHLDGFEIYGVEGGMVIRGNTIYQTVEAFAAAPLNIAAESPINGAVVVDKNLLRSANPAYVILAYGKTGTSPVNVVMTNNRLWPDGANGGLFSLRQPGNYSGSGNINYLTGAAAVCC